jgi:hypothetical protein
MAEDAYECRYVLGYEAFWQRFAQLMFVTS